MAKYNKSVFYWLQLKEDFFEEDAIEWLEEQENGKEYSLFYLKLCLKSLKTNGILIRNVGKMLVPYDAKKLAELTKIDFDTVVVAMDLLKQIGLVKILENGAIYIEQLGNLIGSKSIGAFKKEQQRLLKGGQGVDKCPPKIELDIELDIDIEQEQQLNNNSVDAVVDFYQKNIGMMTSYNLEILNSYRDEGMLDEVIIYAMKQAVEQRKENRCVY